MAGHSVARETQAGFEGVVLSSDSLHAAFCPEVGMVGYSLEHDGDELLGQRGGLPAYAERGSSFGIPLLHPWANRLSALAYEAAGRRVELDFDRMPLRPDEHGLPIHGVLAASRHWEVVESEADDSRAFLAAHLDFAARDEYLAAFPYPHDVRLEVTLHRDTLTVETIVTATGEDQVPISFGWHPYFTLPGVPRSEWTIDLPVHARAALDEQGIPAGGVEAVEPGPRPLGDSVFDDLFPALERPACFVLEGGGRRIEVEQDLGAYPVAQLYAPEGSEFVCWEPMTAPTNALVDGEGLRFATPGQSFAAAFSVRVA